MYLPMQYIIDGVPKGTCHIVYDIVYGISHDITPLMYWDGGGAAIANVLIHLELHVDARNVLIHLSVPTCIGCI